MPKAMLIDISKCIGCRGCQVACKQWNELPAVPTRQRGTYENPPELSASTWTRVEFRESPGEWTFRKHQCMHCTNASCVNVCPTGAAAHHGEFVEIDQKWCIGCGYCVVACPFGAVHREPPSGTARKCTFCIDRVTNGLTPACAKTCPPGAIQFGERADLIAAAHRRVATLASNGHPQARIYGETELGGLAQMYILTKPALALGLPETPEVATSRVLAQWLSGIITAGVVAALPFWWLFRRRKRLEAEEQSKLEGGTR